MSVCVVLNCRKKPILAVVVGVSVNNVLPDLLLVLCCFRWKG